MKTSETTKAVLPALLKARVECGVVRKDAKNPHFKSTYATLSSEFAAVLPALYGNGLLLAHTVVHYDGYMRMVARITHAESGEWVEASVPFMLAKEDSQAVGSAATYCRRYTTECLLGLAAADDDGNAASVPARLDPAKNPALSTKAQHQKIGILRKELGLDDAAYRANLEKLTGKVSSKELTKAEASEVIDRMTAKVSK